MKLTLSSARSAERGTILVVCLCSMLVIGLALLTFLQLGKNQNQLVFRAQVWNACMPLAEAGLEDALNHCGWNSSNWISSGWSLSSSNTVYRSNTLSTADGWYSVSIATNGLVTNTVTITSIGYYPMPGSPTYVARTVKVVASKLAVYKFAIYGASLISFNGNGIVVDSYDSRSPAKSLLGMYNAALAGDKGDVGTYNGKSASYDIGNGNIWGHVYMGPGGTVNCGANGKAGSVSWQKTGPKSGVESGWLRTDLNVNIPTVVAPPSGGVPALRNTKIGGKTYDFVFSSGSYQESTITGGAIVTGDAVIYCTGKFDVDKFVIQTNASVILYVGGSVRFGDSNNQTKRAANFEVLGLPTCLSLDLDNDFMGAVYAPQSSTTLNGNKAIYGSICAQFITLKGGSDIHYDEALADPISFKNQKRGFVISSWTEL